MFECIQIKIAEWLCARVRLGKIKERAADSFLQTSSVQRVVYLKMMEKSMAVRVCVCVFYTRMHATTHDNHDRTEQRTEREASNENGLATLCDLYRVLVLGSLSLPPLLLLLFSIPKQIDQVFRTRFVSVL